MVFGIKWWRPTSTLIYALRNPSIAIQASNALGMWTASYLGPHAYLSIEGFTSRIFL
jgi:hypothetical protein